MGRAFFLAKGAVYSFPMAAAGTSSLCSCYFEFTSATQEIPIPFLITWILCVYLLFLNRQWSLLQMKSSLVVASLGWGPFHLGFSVGNDREPGRCRRTDGKKWRCSSDVVPDQKYCERHINRGRHRSRKPVEVQTGHAVSGSTTSKQAPVASCSAASWYPDAAALVPCSVSSIACSTIMGSMNKKQMNRTPSTISSMIGRRITHCAYVSWPEELNYDWTQLSMSIPMAPPDFSSSTSSPKQEKSIMLSPWLPWEHNPIQMSLGMRDDLGEPIQKQSSWLPISWGNSMGRSLGEALTSTTTSIEGLKNFSLPKTSG